MFTEVDAINRLTVRRSCYWRQKRKPDDKGRYGYTHIKEPLRDEDTKKSIDTDVFTIGTATTENGTNLCVAPAFDIDAHNGEDISGKIKTIYDESIKQGFYPIIEASSGDNINDGCHLIYPCKPTLSAWIRPALRGIIHACGLDISKIEIFPKQDTVSEDGYGNFVKTVFQYNNRTGKRGTIINPETMKPFERQDAINHIMNCPDNVFPEIQGIETPTYTIKEATTATTEPIISDMGFNELFGDIDIKPCIKKAYNDKWVLHGTGSQGHDFRLAAVGELLDYDIQDELIHEYFRIQSDYNHKATQKGIDSAKKHKADNGRAMGCKKIKEKCSRYVKGMCETCRNKPKEKNKKEIKKEPKINPDDAEEYFVKGGFISKRLGEEILLNKNIISMSDNPSEKYIFQNGVYSDKAKNEIQKYAQNALGEKSSERRINETLFYVQVKTLTDRKLLNTEKNKINLLNGLYDLNTRKIEPHDPKILTTVQIPVEYNPNAECKEVAKFLCQVLEFRDVLLMLQLMGYLLTADNQIQKAFMLTGAGANGKSKIIALITALLGADNVSNEPLQRLSEDRFACANLFGKLANLFADLPDKGIEDDSMFKSLVGGDRIHGERKFQQAFYFENLARLLFSANDIPRHSKAGHAYLRRWIIVNFPRKFEGGNEDKNILAKITTPNELSGLLNLALLAYEWLKLSDFNFCYAKTTEEVGQEYLLKSDSVESFLVECCTTTEGKTPKKTIFESYIEYAKVKNLAKPLTSDKFYKSMKYKGYETIRPRTNNDEGDRPTCFDGIVIDMEKCEKVGMWSRQDPTSPDHTRKQETESHWYIDGEVFGQGGQPTYPLYLIAETLKDMIKGRRRYVEEIDHINKHTIGKWVDRVDQTTDKTPEKQPANPVFSPVNSFLSGQPTKDLLGYIHKKYDPMSKPDTINELNSRKQQATNELSTKFNVDKEFAGHIFGDYCLARGW